MVDLKTGDQRFFFLNIYRSQTNYSSMQHYLICFYLILIVFNATFSNYSAISRRPVLVVEEAGIPGKNHRPWTSNW